MKYINYSEFNVDIDNVRKILFRNDKSDITRLTNQTIKLAKNDKKVERKIIGVELIPLRKYNKYLDKITTNYHYASSNNDYVDYNALRQKFNINKSNNNNVVVLTLE